MEGVVTFGRQRQSPARTAVHGSGQPGPSSRASTGLLTGLRLGTRFSWHRGVEVVQGPERSRGVVAVGLYSSILCHHGGGIWSETVTGLRPVPARALVRGLRFVTL